MRRVRRAPVRLDGVAGKDGADIASGVVINGNQDIDGLILKLIPRLTAIPLIGYAATFQCGEAYRVDFARGKAVGAKDEYLTLAVMV